MLKTSQHRALALQDAAKAVAEYTARADAVSQRTARLRTVGLAKAVSHPLPWENPPASAAPTRDDSRAINAAKASARVKSKTPGDGQRTERSKASAPGKKA